MGDWHFLGGILEEVHVHSTMVGKIWLTILFIFRMLVLGVAAEDVWNDEQSEFICNTEQPGCQNVCYDRAFPISLVRYWVLQIIFVSTPSLAYMGHALYRLRALEKERQRTRAQLRRELETVRADLADDRRRLERELRQLDRHKLGKAPLRGSLLRSYVAHVVARSAVEVGFMAGQYLLYGLRLEPLYKCEREPCPNAVDCYVSRPTEKSVFMAFMQGIAAVSLLLNLLEILHLGYKKMKSGILDYYPYLRDELDDDCANKPRECVSSSTVGGPKPAIPTSPGGYSPSAEKQAEGRVYPPSAFMPVQGDGKDGLKASKEAPPSPGKGNRNSKTTGPDARSPPIKDTPSTQLKKEAGPEKGPAPLPTHSKEAEPGNARLAEGGRKQRKVSVPSVEGKPDTATSGEAGARTRFDAGGARTASRLDPKRPGRSQTPESVEESSSESRRSPRRLLTAHRTSLRWAATDLRI
ncbi:hypothetical protein SKAU_G00243920 [Synaphobranchus kaupii]|uniref:Gap junction protein n=1 Tax=Synaphobranchus kaupii TaxID=118154 RepID=A0A9Q1IUL6_SYNKA|nr:hypothetical protein SKAU_G00243920 [Synaphobranchus kaupii]